MYDYPAQNSSMAFLSTLQKFKFLNAACQAVSVFHWRLTKTPSNLAAHSNHLLSHHFCGSRIQEWLSWEIGLRLSHKVVIKMLARTWPRVETLASNTAYPRWLLVGGLSHEDHLPGLPECLQSTAAGFCQSEPSDAEPAGSCSVCFSVLTLNLTHCRFRHILIIKYRWHLRGKVWGFALWRNEYQRVCTDTVWKDLTGFAWSDPGLSSWPHSASLSSWISHAPGPRAPREFTHIEPLPTSSFFAHSVPSAMLSSVFRLSGHVISRSHFKCHLFRERPVPTARSK